MRAQPAPRHVGMFTKHTRLGLAAALAVVGLMSAAGCGSSSSSSSTTTTGESAASQRTSWANGVCGALVSWESGLKSARSELKSGTPSKSSVQSVLDQLKPLDPNNGAWKQAFSQADSCKTLTSS